MSPIRTAPVSPALADIVAAERTNIINKAVLRSQYASEKFFPKAVAETRTAKVVSYEQDVFDNAESPLYGDQKAAQIWAVLSGITPAPTFSHEGSASFTGSRGLVVAAIDARTSKWDKEEDGIAAGDVLMVVHEGHQSLMDATGKKVNASLNTLNFRVATEAEITAYVDAQLALRPAMFIKNMGDSLETIGE